MARRDNEAAARALVEAMVVGDDAHVAKKHGIALRTLQNYRTMLSKDPELARLFQKRSREALNATWVKELDDTLKATLTALRTHIDGLYDITPESVEAIVKAFKAASEVAIAREVLGLADHQQDAGPATPSPQDAGGA